MHKKFKTISLMVFIKTGNSLYFSISCEVEIMCGVPLVIAERDRPRIQKQFVNQEYVMAVLEGK